VADDSISVSASRTGGITVPTNAAVAASKQVAAEQRKIVGELRERALTAEREAEDRARAEQAQRDQRAADRAAADRSGDGGTRGGLVNGSANANATATTSTAPNPSTGRATVLDIVA